MNLLAHLDDNGHFNVYEFDTPSQQYDALQQVVKSSGYNLCVGNWDQVRLLLNQGEVHEALDYLEGCDIEFYTGRNHLELVKLNGGWAEFLKPESEVAIPAVKISSEEPMNKNPACEIPMGPPQDVVNSEMFNQNWHKDPNAAPKVMTEERLADILDDISFENTVLDFNWRFRMEHFQMTVGTGDPNFQRVDQASHRRGWLVWAEFERPDTNTGEMGIGRGRDEIIWEDATESSVVKTAWLLVELLVRHELMEGMNYKGYRFFDPHNSIKDLIGIQIAKGRKPNT